MKTFTVVMGAGRCGSTALISFLNSHNNFNIYGENDGIICNLLENIKLLKGLNKYKVLSNKHSNPKYKIQKYMGSEWYNPQDKISQLKTELINSILHYFENEEQYIGFKEIRWTDNNIEHLTILEKYYNVKYVFLQRNLEDQIHSMYRAGWEIIDPKNTIHTINNTIINFLNKKKDTQKIIKNISIDKNFQQEIYNFIVG